jgi:hypothetical protein
MDDNDEVVTVGRILQAEIRGDQLWGSGDFLDPMVNFDAEQAMAQIDAGLGLVSVDLSITEMGFADSTGQPIDPVLWDGDDMDVVSVALASELGGVTIVPFPAFKDARIVLDQSGDPDAIETIGDPGIIGPIGVQGFTEGQSDMAGATPTAPTLSDDGTSITLQDGTSVKVGDTVAMPDPDDGGQSTTTGKITAIDATAGNVTITPDMDADDNGVQPPDATVAITDLGPATPVPPGAADADTGGSVAASLLASSEVRPYTAANFEQRTLSGPTPLTVNPDTGEVFGHLATWGECHVGKMAEGTCVTAPQSKTDYGYFHLSPILTDTGTLDVGKITLGTGHANPRGGFANAVQHYDNSGTAVAVVRAHEDTYGIQVTGQLVHDTPREKIEELMRSPLSGDWRSINHNLELTAALAVNVPGFPVRRPTPKVGLARDQRVGQLSLVAAGVLDVAGRGTGVMTLPSGATLSLDDFEGMVASMTELLERRRVTRPHGEAQREALSAARTRLARNRLRAQRSTVSV